MMELNYAHPTGPTLQEEYKIPFTQHEVKFLIWFYPAVMGDPRHRFFRVLEIGVFHEFVKRCNSKIHAGEKTKLKLKMAEVLATKRLLMNTAFLAGWTVESNSILFKLDQLTVGIQ